MQISAINNSTNQLKNNNVGFKAAIPVAYWEKIGKEYKLVDNITEVKRMQDVFIRRANGTGGASDAAMAERRMVMGLLKAKDKEYGIEYNKYIMPGLLKLAKKIAGSFYPNKQYTGWQYGKFNPLVVLMTGLDNQALNDMGRGIGYEIRKGSPEVVIDGTKSRYVSEGRRLASMTAGKELHVIMEKNKNGGYRIVKLGMYPAEGPESPYTIMGYYK